MYIPPSLKTGSWELRPYIDQSKNKMEKCYEKFSVFLSNTLNLILTLYLCIHITLANKENLKCKLKIKKQ